MLKLKQWNLIVFWAWMAAAGAINMGCGSSNGTGDDEGATATPPDDPEAETATPAVQISLSGAVEKGPFILGSSVSVSPVDASGNPSGQVFPTTIASDLGDFEVQFSYHGLTSLEAVGFYYNEVSGELSTASLTLRAFYFTGSESKQSATINIITHLTYSRIRELMSSGLVFLDAQQQAENELRMALKIGPAEFVPTASAVEMNVLSGDTDANAYLFAVSTVFMQAATDAAQDGGSVDGELQQYLNTVSNDLKDDGKLNSATIEKLKAAEQRINIFDVNTKLQQRLNDLGSQATIPDLNRFIDTDGDTLVNGSDNCPLTANPGQEVVSDGLCEVTIQEAFVLPGNMSFGIQGIKEPFDLNHDGLPDLIGSTLSGTDIRVAAFIQTADGHIEVHQTALAYGRGVALGDLNEDGNLDLILLTEDSGMLFVPGDGQGDFGSGTKVSTFSTELGVWVAYVYDWNHDSHLDVIYENSDLLQFLPGKGDGTFGPPELILDFTDGDYRYFSLYTMEDFNDDSEADILIYTDHGYNGLPDFRLLLNGSDSVSPLSIENNTVMLYYPEFADMQGDETIDILYGADSLFVAYGNGDGTFGVPHDSGLPYLWYDHFYVNLNSDKLRDVVMFDAGYSQLHFSLQSEGVAGESSSYSPGDRFMYSYFYSLSDRKYLFLVQNKGYILEVRF